MKKNFMYAIMSAIALSGAVSFSACQSGDEIIDNPNYNPEDKTVKTEFVINVTQPGERTRQTSDIAGNGDFQGLNDMYLICLPAAPTTTTVITPASQILSITGAPDSPSLDNSTPPVTQNSSKWYTLYIPTTTTNFLFYGKTESGNPAYPAYYGKLNYDVANQNSVGDIEFSLSPIASAMTTDEATLVGYLNEIVRAKEGTTNKTWADAVDLRDGGDIHYKALADAYVQFTRYSATSGVRQGSAAAILSMVADLYNTMDGIYNNETGTPQDIAGAVKTAITNNFTYVAASNTATFKSTSLPATTTNYPQGLPAGSAILKFTPASGGSLAAFSYENSGTIGTATIATPMAKFTYPAELAYYCKSTLRATSSNVTTSTLPTTSTTWIDDAEWSSTVWNQTAVDGSTRAVAMKENVTYGVAQLVSTITTNNVSVFTDNANAVTTGDGISGNDIANQSIDLSGASDYLKVTGIIIGSQPQTAGYDYLPKSGTSYGYAIYDRAESNSTSATSLSDKTIVGNSSTTNAVYYTLALDNYGVADGTVNVAIEFVASKDFFGKDGLIKAGQPFYLLGALDPSTKSDIDWSKHYSFKEGDNGRGTSEDNKKRVFIRDAKTEATFTLSNTSLQNAYSTIPDLRSTQMLFGLSVDLDWKPGLIFTVNI